MQENLVISGDKGAIKEERAIEQINKTFTCAKRMKVGAQKPGDPSVTAVSVTEIIPS